MRLNFLYELFGENVEDFVENLREVWEIFEKNWKKFLKYSIKVGIILRALRIT